MYVAAYHLLAGLAVGSVFAIRTLLVSAGLVLVEGIVATVAYGVSSGLLLLGGLVALQIGYLGGICLRSVFEFWRVTAPRPGHLP